MAAAAEAANQLNTLAEKITQLCARCEQLHSDNARLQKENRRLTRRCDTAKAQLQQLLAELPPDAP